MTARTRTLGARLLVVTVLGLAALVGCETLVGSALPDFTCTVGDPSACPEGLACDPDSLRCIPEGPGGDDGGDGSVDDVRDAPAVDARDSAPPDAPKDTNPGPQPLGAICRVDTDCQSHICGDQSVLTPAIVTTTGPVCTAPCCHSEDCPADDVCFAAGTGGSYCVAATVAGRTPLGAAAAGATCVTGATCRSGLCAATKCVDTCCQASDCTNGTACRVTTVDAHLVFACGDPVGATAPGSACLGDTSCTTNLCVGSSGLCRPRCCGTASCVAQGFSSGHCGVGVAGADAVEFCYFSGGGTATGQTCFNSSECKSQFCDPVDKVCAELCCTDSDCASDAGQAFVCTPSPLSPRYLRCARQ